MSLLPASSSGEVSTGFYNGAIDQSLRFENGDSSNLYKTFSSGNQKTFTISFWIKRATIASYMNVFDVGSSGSNYCQTRFQNDDQLLIVSESGGGVVYNFETTQKFRDTTNWYHIVIAFDTTQSTESDRVKIYVNGSQITDFDAETYPSQNADTLINTNSTHYIGKLAYAGQHYLDGYLAEYNFIDGTQLTPSSFGETKNGVWIPKAISGLTYGTNGFRLTFADNSAVGDDTSGNGNDWSVGGLASTDVVLDSPENNFMTFNFLHYADTTVPTNNLTEGALRFHADSDDGIFTTMEIPTSGKWYVEFVLAHVSKPTGVYLLGNKHRTRDDWTHVANYTSFLEGFAIQGSTNKVFEYGGTQIGSNHSNGTIYAFLIDVDNSTYDIYQNDTKIWDAGTFNHPGAGEGVIIGVGNNSDSGTNNCNFYLNAGQDSSFAGAKTAQGNTDANGIGDFYYTTKGGLALCSANLPDTTLSPDQDEQADDHFNTVLYTANNSTNAVTGVGFQPDLVWIKRRDTGAAAHAWWDSSRGTQKWLYSDGSGAEISTSDGLSSFDSDGFTLGADSTYGSWNNSGNHVSWNWKLNGGTTSSDTNGNRTTTVQVNSTTGMAIAEYNNPSQSNHTFGHGLGSKPEAFIWRARNTTMNWIWWDSLNFTDADRDGEYLNASIGFTSGSNWVNDVTDTIINITDGQVSSGNNINYWCWSLKSVEGFSKINNYTGNGSTDGIFVYTGFRPAWIMTRNVGGGNWYINDTARSPANPTSSFGANLYADLNNVESGNGMDILSNGFKIRNTDSSQNASGNTYVYMAFAEQPFKFSNAR